MPSHDQILDCARRITDACDAVGVSAVVYGSLAFAALLSRDDEVIRDFDVFVSESDFPRIRSMLDEMGFSHETFDEYHTIHASDGVVSVEFDSIEHWLSVTPSLVDVEFHGLRLKSVSIDTLREIYDYASQHASDDNNRCEYARKRRLLDEYRDESGVESSSLRP